VDGFDPARVDTEPFDGFDHDRDPAATPCCRAAPTERPDWQSLPPPHPLLRAVVIVPATD
jgi:hypothetical protein